MRRKISVLLLAVALAAAPVTPAGADVRAERDPRGDVRLFGPRGEVDTGSYPVDVARITLAHDVRDSARVRATMRFHKLARRSWDFASVQIDTTNDRAEDFLFGKFKDGVTYILDVNSGREVDKPGCRPRMVTFSVNYETDKMTWSAPRACFNTPGGVRGRANFIGYFQEDGRRHRAEDPTGWTALARRG